MKKLKLEDIKLQSFITGEKQRGGRDLISVDVSNCGGFTCRDVAGCGTVFSLWGGGPNTCENTDLLFTQACPQL